MKISGKLILGFVLVAIIAGMVGFVGISNIKVIDENGNAIYEDMTVPLEELAEIGKLFQIVRVNTRDMMIEDEPEKIELMYKNITDTSAIFNEKIVILDNMVHSQEFTDALDYFSETRVGYVALLKEHYDLCIQNKDAEAFALLQGDMKIASAAEEEAIDALVGMKVAEASEKNDANHSAMESSLITMLALIGIAVVIAIGLGIILARVISKPLVQMVEAANQIADGNLDVAINLDTKDEIGSLAQAFRNMTENINAVMTNINSASEQVAAGSMQVSDSSMSLSQGATEQASSIEQLTASIEEIASQSKQNAENAETAEEMSGESQKIAEQGNLQMANMVNAMVEINDSSNSINKIIKVIDDIAFQTNILALNAAVEAARAGAHGKGFAVVAEEVRNLAAKSASAAKETTSMIEGSIQKVEVGTKLANETARALDKIVEGAMQANQLIGQIVAASQEQSQGIGQINQGIAQISEVIQTTSATSEETAAASEELSGQADMLKSQVATFKLRRSDGAKGSQSNSIDPDVLSMLENMSESQQPKNDNMNAKKISLSDSDFEKY